jgi:ketosteroid isomerase-like protein
MAYSRDMLSPTTSQVKFARPRCRIDGSTTLSIHTGEIQSPRCDVGNAVDSTHQETLMTDQDNIAVVQQAYNNFAAGDMPALVAQMDSSIEWETPEMADVRISGTRHGVDKVQEFFSFLADDQEVISFEPREFTSNGETVVALGHYNWRVRATGKTFESDFAHVFTVHNGMVVRFREYADTNAIAEAYRRA